MIEKVKNDIRDRISLVETGSFTFDDIRLLFIDLRDSLPVTDQPNPKISQIYDVFNFAAHPNSRERGKTFRVSKKIVAQFVRSIKQGGSVQINLLELNITESLRETLNELNISYDKDRLDAQENKLKLNVYRMLDGVEMEIKEDAIESANIYYDAPSGAAFISFKVKPFNNTIGGLTISGSPTMRFRLI